MINNTYNKLILYMLTICWININLYKTRSKKMMMININLFGQLENKSKFHLNCRKKYLRTISKEREENSFSFMMNKAMKTFPLQL